MVTSMVHRTMAARNQWVSCVHTGRATAAKLLQACRLRNARPLSNRAWQRRDLASALPVGRIAIWTGPRRLRGAPSPVGLLQLAARGGLAGAWPTRGSPGPSLTPSVRRGSAPRAQQCAHPTVAAAMGDSTTRPRGGGLRHGGRAGGRHVPQRPPAPAGVHRHAQHTPGWRNPVYPSPPHPSSRSVSTTRTPGRARRSGAWSSNRWWADGGSRGPSDGRCSTSPR